jgi:hypothetical protein
MPISERHYSRIPDRILMILPEAVSLDVTSGMASRAVQYAQQSMPKISGRLAGTILPVYSATYWGLYFPDRRAWYLEQGTRPFTMNSLAGKTIPMWVDDPDGSVAKEEGRKAQTRITVDGRRQTLIYRKAAKKGERKWVRRGGRMVSVPRSYPGAPGRIGNRLSNGQIGSPNVGVRWRHPGINGRQYLNRAMEAAAMDYGIVPDSFRLVDSATFSMATRS